MTEETSKVLAKNQLPPRVKQEPKDLLTNQEAADLLRIAAKTLSRWRVRSYGPLYSRVGKRALYDRKVVLEWIKNQQEDRVDGLQLPPPVPVPLRK